MKRSKLKPPIKDSWTTRLRVWNVLTSSHMLWAIKDVNKLQLIM